MSNECLTRSALEEVPFFVTVPLFLLVSVHPSLCLYLLSMLLFGLVYLMH